MKFITRFVYFFTLLPEQKFCCKNTNRIRWITPNNLLNSFWPNLWGPELIEFVKLSLTPPIQTQIYEFSLEEAFFFVPREPPRNMEELILRTSHITEKDVERLYSDFIEHCFPSFYQALESFKCYMEKYGFDKNDNRLPLLFNAFNFYANGFLSFHELLLGLAAIDPNTIHDEWRARFIFRYYNVDGSGYLNKKQMRKMVMDINPNLKENEIDAKLSEAFEQCGATDINGELKICENNFIAAIGSHRFRGTSKLCRSSDAIFLRISRIIAARNLKSTLRNSKDINCVLKQFKGHCFDCKNKQYTLATHVVTLNSESDLVDSKPIFTDTKSSAKKHSIEFTFKTNSSANILIKLIQEFNPIKGNVQQPRGVLDEQPEKLWKLLLALYSDLEPLLNRQAKCLNIKTPCYIFGDIHGNLEDLLTLEKFWKRMPCLGANYLFLGDYVDRGQWSLECCLYLMSFKLLCPNKVTLLRGNHEVRALQTNYTYKKECTSKYGQNFGLKIWELTNRLFDKLPICAIVDKAIYCAHGGIPKTVNTISDINSLPLILADPENDSDVAWEILWSDPCHNGQFIEICNFLKIDYKSTNGYLPNVKRGTTYLFNELSTNLFLRNNGLTHIIRGHEVPQPGFYFHFGTKCMTIFSCSHYCGNNNICACIYADNEILRIICIDTVNNASATD